MSKSRRGDDPHWNWDDAAVERRQPGDLDSLTSLRPQSPFPAPKRTRRKSRGPLIVLVGLLVLVGLGAAGYFLLTADREGMVSAIGGGGAPAESRPSITLAPSEQVVFSGQAGEISVTADNTVQQQSSSADNGTVIVRSRETNAQPGGPPEGAYVTLTPEETAALAGRRVRVTAWARAAEPDPSNRFGMAFATERGDNPAGTSGWLVFTPTRAFQPFSFDVVVSKEAERAHIGVWSDLSGRGGGIELRLLTIRPLS